LVLEKVDMRQRSIHPIRACYVQLLKGEGIPEDRYEKVADLLSHLGDCEDIITSVRKAGGMVYLPESN
jgi:hypothetical protein